MTPPSQRTRPRHHWASPSRGTASTSPCMRPTPRPWRCACSMPRTGKPRDSGCPARTGPVFHGHIPDVAPGTRYGLRAYGPWDPANGHRFNSAKLLIDPWATAIDRPFRLHAELFDHDGPRPDDTAALMPKAIIGTPPRCPSPTARLRLGPPGHLRSCMSAASPRPTRTSRRRSAAPSPALGHPASHRPPDPPRHHHRRTDAQRRLDR